MATIADRKPDALLELGNRSDIDNGAPSRLDKWFRDSYIELAYSIPFSELEFTTDGAFVVGVDTYAYPANLRAIRGKLTAFDPTSGSAIQLDMQDISIIRAQTNPSNIGPPSIYAPFGNSIVVRPVPDQQYQFKWDGWGKPSISATISSTVLNVPTDWLEIVDMGAILRGFRNLGERDKAQEIQQLLFGFKTETGKQIPGLITNRMTMKQAQASVRDYGLKPRRLNYT